MLTRMSHVQKIWEFNPGPTKSNQHCKQLVIASTSMQVLCCLGAMLWKWALQTHYMLWRNTMSITKGLVFGLLNSWFVNPKRTIDF